MTGFLRQVIVLAFVTAGTLSAHPHRSEEPNNGEDVTRPLTRIDQRIEYQRGDNGPQSRAWIATLRMDKSIHFPNKWQIGLRADLPYEWYRCCNKSNCLTSVDCFGDSLAQIFIIPPSIGRWTWAYGLHVIFPTAGDNLQVGEGKLQLLPSFAFKYDLGFLSPGAYIGLIAREAFSVAGYASAPYVSQTYLQPFFNWNFPHGWFITMSPEMRYNRTISKWFVPFDIMLGKMLNPKLVVSLEYECAIVYDYKQFTQEVEFRVGFFY